MDTKIRLLDPTLLAAVIRYEVARRGGKIEISLTRIGRLSHHTVQEAEVSPHVNVLGLSDLHEHAVGPASFANEAHYFIDIAVKYLVATAANKQLVVSVQAMLESVKKRMHFSREVDGIHVIVGDEAPPIVSLDHQVYKVGKNHDFIAVGDFRTSNLAH